MRSTSYRLAALLLLAVASCTTSAPYRDVLTLEQLRDADGWYAFSQYKYRGALRDGMPNGAGEARYTDGTSLRSTFVDGVASGPATIVVPGYGTIEGTVRGGELVNGEVWLESGDYYRGGFKALQFEGQGLAITKRGELASGTFANGALNGVGTIVRADGSRVEGNFRGGRPTGDALVSGPNGPDIRTYDQNGVDRTAATLANQVIDQLSADARQAAQARAREEERLRNDIRPLEERRDRLTIDPEKNPAYRERCYCTMNACLEVISGEESDRRSRLTEEERKAEREASDRARAARYRVCSEWLEEFKDPSRPQRAQAVLDEIEQKSAALTAMHNARLRAEDEARALEKQRQEARMAAYQQSVRDGIARAEAERKAEAAKREAEHKNRCATSPSYARCYCQPPTPPTPGVHRASCQ